MQSPPYAFVLWWDASLPYQWPQSHLSLKLFSRRNGSSDSLRTRPQSSDSSSRLSAPRTATLWCSDIFIISFFYHSQFKVLMHVTLWLALLSVKHQKMDCLRYFAGHTSVLHLNWCAWCFKTGGALLLCPRAFGSAEIEPSVPSRISQWCVGNCVVLSFWLDLNIWKCCSYILSVVASIKWYDRQVHNPLVSSYHFGVWYHLFLFSL